MRKTTLLLPALIFLLLAAGCGRKLDGDGMERSYKEIVHLLSLMGRTETDGFVFKGSRAYLADAPIMILDDSVSAVDVETEEKILANIRRERAGRTTFIIASRVSSVAHADRIIVLSDGRLEAFDTPERLLEISPTYSRMVRLQELEKEVKGGR